jgi:hypothetical protein
MAARAGSAMSEAASATLGKSDMGTSSFADSLTDFRAGRFDRDRNIRRATELVLGEQKEPRDRVDPGASPSTKPSSAATRHDAQDFLFAAPAAARPAPNRLTLPILCAAVLVAQVGTSVVNLATRPIGEHFAADVDSRYR